MRNISKHTDCNANAAPGLESGHASRRLDKNSSLPFRPLLSKTKEARSCPRSPEQLLRSRSPTHTGTLTHPPNSSPCHSSSSLRSSCRRPPVRRDRPRSDSPPPRADRHPFRMTGLAAFRLPVPHIGAAAAAVSVAAPLPALAYHDLAPGAKYGDVAMSGDGMLSAGLGLALTAGESRSPSSQLVCVLFSKSRLRHPSQSP